MAREGDPRADRAIVGALVGLLVLATFVIASVRVGQSGESEANAVASAPAPSIRAIDRERHVVFRRTLRTLTVKVGEDAPAALARRARLGARLACVHTGPRGTSVYERRVRLAPDARIVSVTLPAAVAAAPRVCALRRRGETLARASFPSPSR